MEHLFEARELSKRYGDTEVVKDLSFQIAKGELVFTFYALIVFTYAITIAYALALRYLHEPKTLRSLASFQCLPPLGVPSL